AGTRMNFLAVLVCALVYYGIESVWFTLFGTPWLRALGKTIPEILVERNGRPTWPLYVGAFLCTFLIALVMAWVFARSGVRSALAGIQWAAILWFGFVATVMFTNDSFEIRNRMLIVIDAGGALAGMLATGAILGGWRKKVPSTLVVQSPAAS
ncbi:MAG: DUF1761 domain-containing protein, partial [Candidatus Acidiferrales bacterium]